MCVILLPLMVLPFVAHDITAGPYEVYPSFQPFRIPQFPNQTTPNTILSHLPDHTMGLLGTNSAQSDPVGDRKIFGLSSYIHSIDNDTAKVTFRHGTQAPSLCQGPTVVLDQTEAAPHGLLCLGKYLLGPWEKDQLTCDCKESVLEEGNAGGSALSNVLAEKKGDQSSTGRHSRSGFTDDQLQFRIKQSPDSEGEVYQTSHLYLDPDRSDGKGTYCILPCTEITDFKDLIGPLEYGGQAEKSSLAHNMFSKGA